MDKKPQRDNKSFLSKWSLTPEESTKLYTHFFGPMAIVLLVAVLLYWIVEILKAV